MLSKGCPFPAAHPFLNSQHVTFQTFSLLKLIIMGSP